MDTTVAVLIGVICVLVLLPFVRLAFRRWSGEDSKQRFVAGCDREPVLCPLHAIRYRATVSQSRFRETVDELADDWDQRSLYPGRGAVLRSFNLIYGCLDDEVSAFEFAASMTVKAHQVPGDPEQELRKSICEHELSGVLVGWHKAIHKWLETEGLVLEKTPGSLSDVVESWPVCPETMKRFDDVFPFACKMNEGREDLETVAELLARWRKAQKQKPKGGQRTKKHQKADQATLETACKRMDDLRERAQSWSGSLGKAGTVEASLVARCAAVTANQIQLRLRSVASTDDLVDGTPTETTQTHDRAGLARVRVPRFLLVPVIVVLGIFVLVFFGGLRPEIRESVVKVQTPTGLGTGFLVDAQLALFATNKHVVTDKRTGLPRRQIRVEFPAGVTFPEGKVIDVEVLILSETSDLAILRANDAPAAQSLPLPLELGTSSSISQGDPVTVIGHPAGEEFSELHPRIAQIDKSQNVLRLDGSQLDVGCSGAPVVDANGQVIAVVFALRGAVTTRSQAIPVESLQHLLERAQKMR